MSIKNMFASKGQEKSAGPDSILANMLKNIILENCIKTDQWETLVTRYIKDPRNAIPDNQKDRYSERGNLRKELFKSRISWKVFCKALRVLNFPRFDLTITLYHNNIEKKITVHKLSINLGEPLAELKNEKEGETT